jgi:hypothetical protein
VTLLSGRDTNILLCLYDFDVDYRLLRIDMSQPFKPPASTSYLNRIVFRSDWLIEDGSAGDWQETLDYLHSVPPTVFAHQSVPLHMRLNTTPNSILKQLADQGIR